MDHSADDHSPIFLKRRLNGFGLIAAVLLTLFGVMITTVAGIGVGASRHVPELMRTGKAYFEVLAEATKAELEELAREKIKARIAAGEPIDPDAPIDLTDDEKEELGRRVGERLSRDIAAELMNQPAVADPEDANRPPEVVAHHQELAKAFSKAIGRTFQGVAYGLLAGLLGGGLVVIVVVWFLLAPLMKKTSLFGRDVEA